MSKAKDKTSHLLLYLIEWGFNSPPVKTLSEGIFTLKSSFAFAVQESKEGLPKLLEDLQPLTPS